MLRWSRKLQRVAGLIRAATVVGYQSPEERAP